MEMEALRADGSIFHVELAITEAETEGQRVFAASLRDLTEQHRRAAALEQSVRENDFYRRMFGAMPDSVHAKDLDGRFIAANEALAQAMGAGSQSDLIGHGRDVTERVKPNARLRQARRALPHLRRMPARDIPQGRGRPIRHAQ